MKKEQDFKEKKKQPLSAKPTVEPSNAISKRKIFVPPEIPTRGRLGTMAPNQQKPLEGRLLGSSESSDDLELLRSFNDAETRECDNKNDKNVLVVG